ncbi:hypothetical protein BD324DRAFT_143968 [Kockovaella imperatae]|uniref:Uncharacterized protein n=1 Tax=Kockovaella imperatae TaxID=4999 RepID=A0A1Y1U9Y1_9TREE|nr:hypothetical protein BD324DRAFT_143968 [Kockovaella imperatae]ORX34354.1 hypothetical protein BD324DRAFT_143968 [Kockovaella imperatae]
MPITLTQGPISAKTPTDLFATLALSPPLGSILPSAVPTIAFSPPTPPTAISLTQAQAYLLEQHLDSEGVDDRDKNGMSEDGGDSILPSASFNPPPTMPGPVHRPLASNEARQLSLLLTQHFFPLRSQPRSMMKESIHLAEKLHEAGIRWDTKRRVMGLHLRGIWEEGQKLSYTRTAIGGHGPMDLYVQGSFLSIAEEPHPLDPMPIPLELHPASFAALPKLTLQAGLANALPVAATHMDHHTMGDGPHQVIHRDFARDPSEMVHAVHGEVGDRHVGLEIQVEMMPDKEAAPVHKSVKDKWRDRKAKSLRIHTDGCVECSLRLNSILLHTYTTHTLV